MRTTGPGKRLTIYFQESDKWQGQALHKVLFETLKSEGLAGATLTRGIAGFGTHSRIHTASIEVLSTDLPLVLEVVDQTEKIEAAISRIRPMVEEGLLLTEDV